MFSKPKNKTGIDLEQHEQIEYAQKRIREKKNLFRHFVWFLIGSVALVILNKVFRYGDPYNWSYWATAVWVVLLLVHFVNVFILNEFMGRDWERQQREKLVLKQRERIAELKKQAEKDFPLPTDKKKAD
jgi:membrane protein YdbS with pleckstrin-like domain